MKARRINIWSILLAAVLLGACASPATPAATAPPPPASTATALPAAATPTARTPEGTYPEIPRVSLEEAKAALDAGTALFIDVRAAQFYEVSHVKGAINIYFGDIEKHLGELDKAQWIITYCT